MKPLAAWAEECVGRWQRADAFTRALPEKAKYDLEVAIADCARAYAQVEVKRTLEEDGRGTEGAMSERRISRTLVERRAEFVYEAARLAAIAAQASVIPMPWADREEPFRAQFLRVIERQCDAQRSLSPEKLHESWVQAYLAMGWTHGEAYDPVAKVHPDLVPYNQLDRSERDKDDVFIALCEIARQWIYDA